MSGYSYHVTKGSEPLEWQSREDLAAAAFIGMALWIIFDVNFAIIRLFKRKKGLYHWSCQMGLLGYLINAPGVMVLDTQSCWPIYTLLLLLGWIIFAPFQLLVLYSRLYLVKNNHRVQKLILWTIC